MKIHQKGSLIKDWKEFFFQEDWIDFLLNHLSKDLSLNRIHAKIMDIKVETATTKTFVLKPNLNWKGFKAGQHIPVTLWINGRRLTRMYSITSKTNDHTISITVKNQPNGIASNYLNEKIKKGDLIEIGKPQGEFVLKKEDEKSKLLFIAGGSGITPILSILKNHNLKDAVLIYFSKNDKEFIAYEELKTLESTKHGLRIEFIPTDSNDSIVLNSLLSEELLSYKVKDFKERLTFVCGPEGLKNIAISIINPKNLRLENFTLKLLEKKSSQNHFVIKLSKSNKVIQIKGEKSLLEELESEGIYPEHGCRMGICHTCICKKNYGMVENLQTGNLMNSDLDKIQLCITRPETDLELEL
jgi:stearoyl-CoA 9-desaturase NADPH oxidoreductase